MFILILLVALAVLISAVPVSRLVYRSYIRTQLESLSFDRARIKRMTANTPAALEFIHAAEACHGAALLCFESNQLRAAQKQIIQAYVNLQKARRLVQPDPQEEDTED